MKTYCHFQIEAVFECVIGQCYHAVLDIQKFCKEYNVPYAYLIFNKEKFKVDRDIPADFISRNIMEKFQ